jgi:hypothetical protein
MLDDLRQVPYLMVWKDRCPEDVVEAVRVCASSRPDSLDGTGRVEVKRADGSRSLIRTVQCLIPRNGGRARLIICPLCQKPRQGLYAWRLNPSPTWTRGNAESAPSCATLRKAVHFFADRERPSAKCWLPSTISRDMTVLSRFIHTYLRILPMLRQYSEWVCEGRQSHKAFFTQIAVAGQARRRRARSEVWQRHAR